MDQTGIAKTPHQKALRLGFLYPNIEVHQEQVKNVAPEGRAPEPTKSNFWNEVLGAIMMLQMSPQKTNKSEGIAGCQIEPNVVRPEDRALEPPSSHRRSLLTAVSLFLNLTSLPSDAPHIGQHLYHTYVHILYTPHCYYVLILIFCNGCFMKKISST